MKVIERPYDLGQLMALSRDGKERVTAVIAVAWHELLHREAEAFEEDMCRRVTGSKYGLEDLAVKLVGCLGQDVLLEVSGLVGTFLENYDEWLAEEPRRRPMNEVPDVPLPMGNDLNLVREWAVGVMRSFELHDWSFGFDHARRRLGACHYRTTRITLSRHFVAGNGPAEIRETVLHEVAHALVGRGHGHGPVWKAMARRVGCLPVRCGTAEMPRGQWRAACPSCGRAFHRHRRPRRMDGWSCRSCGRLRGRLEWRLAQDEVA